MNDEIILKREGSLAIIGLNRPQHLNTLSPGILDGLAAIVPDLCADDEVRAIMLVGSGRAFCAGGDVGSMGGKPEPERLLAGMRSYHGWLTALRCGDKPVVAAVNGVAAGGGFGLAMACDFVVASEAAFFKPAFGTLGAAADYGLGFTLPRIVGPLQAARILFDDRRITAREAAEFGFVTEVYPADDFEAQSLQYAHRLANMARGAQLTKRLLRFEERDALPRYLEAEAAAAVEAFLSADFAEGVAAFTEKRRPLFRGR